jgi:hypothetical protein
MKLTVSQLVEKFSAFYGNLMFITAFTTARYMPSSSARSVHASPFHFSKIHF